MQLKVYTKINGKNLPNKCKAAKQHAIRYSEDWLQMAQCFERLGMCFPRQTNWSRTEAKIDDQDEVCTVKLSSQDGVLMCFVLLLIGFCMFVCAWVIHLQVKITV